MRRPLTPVLLGTAVLLAACGGGSATTARTAAPTVGTSPTACPQASASPVDAWPTGVPTSLPRFPGLQVTSTTQAGSRTTVTFTTPQSLREAVTSILRLMPSAGYVLGRGEAERVDAEAPFSSREVNGAFRVLETDECASQWLLVLEPRAVFDKDPQPLVTVSALPSASASAFGG